MSASLLERLGIRTPEQPIKWFNPDVVAGSLPGWEYKEDKEPFSHPLSGWHTGWYFFRRLDPSDKSDYTSISTHSLLVHQSSPLLVVIDFAGHPDAGWTVRNPQTFKVDRNGSITFVGANGKYRISDGGNLHSFEPSDGGKTKRVDINGLQQVS